MFSFIKKIFTKKDNTNDSEELISLKIQLSKLKVESENMKDELDWFYSLGLPKHQLLEPGFDYYDFLKGEIEELRMDKKVLSKENLKLSKALRRMEQIEKLYLEKISELQKENYKLTSDIGKIVKARNDKNEFENVVEEVVADVEKEIKNETEAELISNANSPLEEVRKKIAGIGVKINLKA